MDSTGENVVKAFDFLDQFLGDVGKLLSTVEENLTNKGVVAVGDSSIFWEHSRAYYAPTQWLPKYAVRHYTKHQSPNELKNWKTQWEVFFILYLSPISFQKPVAVIGVVQQNGEKNIWRLLKKMGVYQQDPDFFTKVPTQGWETVNELAEELVSFKYQSMWLTELKDAVIVESQVVKPLLDEIKTITSGR